MTVGEEYRQTKSGSLPIDWDLKRFGELGTVVRGGSPRPAGDPRYFGGNFIPWLTVGSLTNISSSQIRVTSTVTMLTQEGSKRSRSLPKETLVIVNSGARTLGVSKILAINCCANDGIVALVNQKQGNKVFVCYVINSQIDRLRQTVAAGNDQLNLNTGRIRLLQIPFPSEREQCAIAEALSDVDALLGALDRLIVKKRNLKQAVMQQLLTGQTRLPGFAGKWDLKRIADVADPVTRLNTDRSSLPVLACSKHLGFLDSLAYFKNQVFSNDLATYKLIRRGEIGYPANHVEEGSIGLQDLYDEALVSPIYVIFAARLDVNSLFLHRLLKSDTYRKRFETATTSSVARRGSLRWPAFSQIEVRLPSLQEQVAIAAVIADMEMDIRMIEARRTKTAAIKQGMMQALLTGRTRLA